jgi:hypothetical protein
MIQLKGTITGVPKTARELDHLGRELSIDAKETTRIIGRSIALFGVRQTYPKTPKSGKTTIQTDFFKVVGEAKNGIADPGFVDKWQNERRRPTTGRTARPPGGKNKDPTTIYATPVALKEAIQRRQLLVGWAKGQWAGVLAKLGGKAPAKWITRHRAVESIMELRSGVTGTRLTIGSSSEYASQVFPGEMQSRAVREGTKNGINFLRNQARARAKAATRKLR